jgi:peptidoglycan/LPS O-acetylase OafA/YrhL
VRRFFHQNRNILIVSKRFFVLDAFRGLCALSVVIYHMHFIDSITEVSFFRGSWIFVEFFFILSGFVLTFSMSFKKTPSLRNYITLRFFRIYPLHIVMLLFFIFLQLIKLYLEYFNNINFQNDSFSGKNTVNEIIPNLFLLQAWTPFTQHSFNYPSWSISIEFYLYILLFGTIVTFRKKVVNVWSALIILALFSLYFNTDFLVMSVKRGVYSFFCGCLLYYIYDRLPSFRCSYSISSGIEVALIALTYFIVSVEFEHKLIITPIFFMLVILFFSYELGIISRILKISQFQKIGQVSYSLYMVHAAVIYCLGILVLTFGKLFSPHFIVKNVEGMHYISFGNQYINNVVVVLTVIFIYYISKFTFKFIEKPSLKIGRKIVEKH